jgi:hypothetical protein
LSLALTTVKLAVRSVGRVRFSVFVTLAGGIVLECKPIVVLVTYTSIRQRCPARIKPPVKEMEVAPVGAVNTKGGVGPQPVSAGGAELLIVIPAGKLSVIEAFVRLVSLGAKISTLSLEFPPASIVEGEKDLIPATSVLVTTTLAFTARKLPTPWSVVSPPAGIVFLMLPEAVPDGTVTSTDMLQVPGFATLPAGMVPPVRLIVLFGAETAPPHEFAVTLTTVNGAGNGSESLTPV